jgi:hypothetical protein
MFILYIMNNIFLGLLFLVFVGIIIYAGVILSNSGNGNGNGATPGVAVNAVLGTNANGNSRVDKTIPELTEVRYLTDSTVKATWMPVEGDIEMTAVNASGNWVEADKKTSMVVEHSVAPNGMIWVAVTVAYTNGDVKTSKPINLFNNKCNLTVC